MVINENYKNYLDEESLVHLISLLENDNLKIRQISTFLICWYIRNQETFPDLSDFVKTPTTNIIDDNYVLTNKQNIVGRVQEDWKEILGKAL